MQALLRRQEFWLALITLLLGLGIGLANPAFLSLANLFDLCKSSTVTGLFALGVLVVLISGGIDVSFAAIGAFSMYVTTKILLALDFQGSVVIAFLLAGAIGIALGLFNAVFIAFFRLPTLIVTLGSASLFRGLLLGLVGTTIVNNLPGGMIRFSKSVPLGLMRPNGTFTGLSPAFLLLVLAALLVGFLLRRTMLGRGLYAMGGNLVAARAGRVQPSPPAILHLWSRRAAVRCGGPRARLHDAQRQPLRPRGHGTQRPRGRRPRRGQHHRRSGHSPRDHAGRSADRDDQQQPDPARHPLLLAEGRDGLGDPRKHRSHGPNRRAANPRSRLVLTNDDKGMPGQRVGCAMHTTGVALFWNWCARHTLPRLLLVTLAVFALMSVANGDRFLSCAQFRVDVLSIP